MEKHYDICFLPLHCVKILSLYAHGCHKIWDENIIFALKFRARPKIKLMIRDEPESVDDFLTSY